MCDLLGGPLYQNKYLTCAKTVFCDHHTLATFRKSSFYEPGNYLVKIRRQYLIHTDYVTNLIEPP